MRRPYSTKVALTLATLLLIGLASFLTSCSALGSGDSRARLHASYVSVIQPAVILGIGVAQDSGDVSPSEAQAARAGAVLLGEFLSGSEEVLDLADTWELLEPYVVRYVEGRIASGEIKAGVGASLLDVIRLFGAQLVAQG